MANERRLYENFVGGLVENDPLAAAATSFTSAGLAGLPVIGASNHAIVIFDPAATTGPAFAKRVTAHGSGASSATIEAAAIAGSAREIAVDTPWVHGELASDIDAALEEVLMLAVGDETTAISAGAGKLTFRMPWAMIVTEVRASLKTASSSGNPAIDVNEGGVSIFSTVLTIDSGEKTSLTAATPAVIADPLLADDAEVTVDIDTAGTGAVGLKLYLYGYKVLTS